MHRPNTTTLALLLCVAAVGASSAPVQQSPLEAPSTQAPPPPPERPHIVLVMADDQGWGDVAYNGHPLLHTPNLDAAAKAGLRFDRFYAAAPVCSPTRASVMTGRHPNRMGVFKWGYPLRPQENTIAELLREGGYQTAHFGKWHLGSVRRGSPASPGAHGFDYWLSAPNFYDNDPVLSRMGQAVQVPGESSIVAADAAIDWMRKTLDKHKENAPLFAVVWFGSPHRPHRAVPEDLAHYEGQPKNQRHFLGEVSGIDRAFGRIRDALTEFGIRENTILWYCSDNGALPKVGSTGGFRGNKGKVYEGGLLVPAILEWPARLAKARSTQVRANTADILPTLLELAGIAVPREHPLDGVSLNRLITAEDPLEARQRPMGFWDNTARGIGTPADKWMRALLAAQKEGKELPPDTPSLEAAKLPDPALGKEQYPGHSAWIDGDWKLHRIERRDKQGKWSLRWELYDLAQDPKETRDLAREADQAERMAKMRKALYSWLSSVVDSCNGLDYR
jgi:arylsulfatase A-like enzyme